MRETFRAGFDDNEKKPILVGKTHGINCKGRKNKIQTRMFLCLTLRPKRSVPVGRTIR